MTRILTIEIDDIEFMIITGNWPHGDGVIFGDSDVKKLANPAYLKSFQVASLYVPYLAFENYYEMMIAEDGYIENQSSEFLEEQLGKLENARRRLCEMEDLGYESVSEQYFLLKAKDFINEILEVMIDKEINQSFILMRPKIYKLYKGICQYCGEDVPKKGYHVDHIFPKSRGGSYKIENLTLACASCNKKKQARTPEEAGMVLLSEVNNG